MVAVVAPVLQFTVPSQLFAVNTTDSPAQICVFALVITGAAGCGFTVIDLDAFALHCPLVQVTS